MKKGVSILGNSGGWTLVEVIITVTILWILMFVAQLTYETIQAKVRYTQIKGDMDGIAQAAYNDYTTTGVWAALNMGGGMPPNWAATQELRKWPTPPCPGWFYSWEDWTGLRYPITQVTVRRRNSTLVYNYCLDNTAGAGNCDIDPYNVTPSSDISRATVPYIYCNE